MAARGEVWLRAKQTRESGEDSLSNMQGRQELIRAMGREQEVSVQRMRNPRTANQVLEELKRNAEARGLDLSRP